MNQKNFKSASTIDGEIPEVPGLYCLSIKDKAGLSEPFSTVLEDRNHSIIYIGIASQSLRKRLNQEIRAKGHGTFGAVLGFTPEQGSLVGKLNQNNYKFSKIDEKKIITWINENLMVNWVSFEENLAGIEILLLQMHSPLLNITGNPGALEEIRQLRETCKNIAREHKYRISHIAIYDISV